MSLPNDQRTVQDSDGNEIPFADIEVRDLAGGLVTIYSDADGTTEITQPGFQSDANGFYRFYAQPGYYEITVTGPEGARVLARVNLERGVTSLSDITSLSSLNTAALVDGQKFDMTGWRTGSDLGGGSLYYDSTRPQTDHDGGTVFALGATPPTDFNDPAQIEAYLNAGSGLTGDGCLVRLDNLSCPDSFGGGAGGDDTPAFAKLVTTGNIKPRRKGVTYNISSVSVTQDLDVDLNGCTLNHLAGAAMAMIRPSGAAVELTIENGRMTGTDISRAARQDLIAVVAGETLGKLSIKNMIFRNASSRSIGGRVLEFYTSGSYFQDSEGYPIQVSGSSSFLVESSAFLFDAAKTAENSDIRAIQPTDCFHVNVQSCLISSARKYRDGIWCNDCDNVSIGGCYIAEHVDDSVTFVGICNDATVSGCVLRGSDVTGAVVTVAGSTVKNLMIDGCICVDGVRAIYPFGAERLTVSDSVFSGYQFGIVFPDAEPSTFIKLNNNTYHNIELFAVDLGTSSDVDIDGCTFYPLTDPGSIAIHGRTSTDVAVRKCKFVDLNNRAIQTGSAWWSVSGCKFVSIAERCVSGGDSAGITDLNVDDCQFKNCDEPLTIVSGLGSTRITANNNTAQSETDQKAAGGPAFQFGDATRFKAVGNTFTDYRRGADSAAGSDNGIFVANDEVGCGATSTLASATTKQVGFNLP